MTCLLLALLLLPGLAQAAASTLCGPFNLPDGGTTPSTSPMASGTQIAEDISACSGFGGLGNQSGATAHGNYSVDDTVFPEQLYYTNNGDGAASDSFTFIDNIGGTVTVNVSIAAPTSSIVLSPGTMPDSTIGETYSQSLSASGGTGPYTFSLTGGALPPGVSLSGATLSGSTTSQGTYSFTIQAEDSLGVTGSKTYSIFVNTPTIVISPSSLPNPVRGIAYSQSLSAYPGTPPYTYSIASGALPAGLTLSSAGVISGTPTTTGSSTFRVDLTDSTPGAQSGPFGAFRDYTVTTVAPPPLTLSPSTLPAPQFGATYSNSVSASNGVAPYSYAVTAGALPAGLSLDPSTGAISGTPTAGGTFNFTITATDSNSTGASTGSQAYSVIINAAVITISPSSLPAGTQGSAYSQTITASGGTAPYAFSLNSGALPTGVTLDSNGTLSGTPTVSGSFNFSVTALDSSTGTGPYTGTRSYTWTIIANDPVISPTSLPSGTAGVAYSQTITASGGTSPYSFAVTTGALPAGLSLDSLTGALSGTPTAGGVFNFTVTVTDDNAQTGSQAYALTVDAPTITLAPTTLPNATVGTGYSQAITPSGGTSPYSDAITAGTLPAGLTLSSSGTLSGTPTTAGSFNFTITATDSSTGTGPYTGSRAYSLTVFDVPGAPTIGTATAGDTQATVSFTAPASDGGSAITSYTVTSSPGGLTATGAGSPITVTGLNNGVAYTFTVTATNSIGTGAASAASNSVTPKGAQTITFNNPGAQNYGTAPTLTATASSGLAVTFSSSTTGVCTITSGGALTFVAAGTCTIDADQAGNGSYLAASTVSRSFTVQAVVPDAPVIGTATAGDGQATVGFTAPASNGGSAITGYTVTSNPGGITATGAGSPITVTGLTNGVAYTFTVTASNSAGTGTTSTASNSVTPQGAQTITFNNPGTQNFGTSPTLTATASSGLTPTFSSTTPAVCTITSGGALTLVAPGTCSIDADQAGNAQYLAAPTVTQSFSVAVPGGSVAFTTSSPLPSATGYVAYSQTIAATGGATPYTFSLTGGSLPAGLTFSTSGVLSGTPTGTGTYNFVLQVTDAATQTATQTYTLTVNAPTITLAPTTLPDATAGAAYNQSVTASGGTAPYSYTLTAGALPPGLSLAPDGTLSGTPTAGGTFNATITAGDANTFTGSQAYTLTVNVATIAVTPASLPAADAGVAYSQTLNASGGTAPYTFAISTGALPAGLTLSSAGTLSGTPTVSGSFNFTITATDSSSGSGPYAGSQAYTLTVNTPTITLSPATLPNAIVATAYSQAITAAGGTGPYTYTLSAGALPAGLALASDGTLSGTPTAGGTFNATVTATDALGFAGSQAYTLTVDAATIAITPASLPAADAGVAYSQSLSAAGGTAPYTFAISAGALPAGLTLATNGTLSGTATVSGSFNFTITATDSSGGSGPYTGSQAYTLTVNAPTITLAPATLPNAIVATAYSQGITAAGGTGPYSYALTTGTLPPGMSLASDGTLSGTPTAGGTFNATVTATDALGFTGSQAYALTVDAATIAITPATLPAADAGVAYSQTLNASGGTAPYTFAITAGALPTGLALSSTGTLSGTPTVGGSFNFTVTATDSSGGSGPYTGSQAYTLTVNAPTIVLTPTTLPDAIVGVAYSQSASAAGGTAPYAYAITAGALPAGLVLASDGTLSGTPTVAGNFGFTITATDANGFNGAQAYTLAVAAPTITVAPASLPNGRVGVAYSQAISASGGSAPYSYTVLSGALPGGLVLSANGTLSGTPTAAGTFGFVIEASDRYGSSGSTSYTVTIADAVPVAVDDSASTQANQAVTVDVTANDSGPIDSIAIATAPTHGTATVNGLDVVYTPANNYFGSDQLTYTATGPGGTSAAATVTITIVPLPVPVGVPQAVTTLAGQAVTIHAANGASGGPFTGVTVLDAPASGQLTVNGTDLVYTPPASASGNVTVQYTLDNVFGSSAPITSTVTINPLPVASAQHLQTSAGVAVSAELTEGASGGPFTDAQLVSVSPANAGSADIAASGTGAGARYRLTFTPDAGFTGTAQVVFTLANAYATSAPATITIDVIARPDPSRDPDVLGLLNAQAETTHRFARAQIGNFQQRMEALHDARPQAGFSNGISFVTPATCGESMEVVSSAECRDRRRGGPQAEDAAPTSAPAAQEAPLFSLWAAGSLRSGDRDAGLQQGSGFDFETDGVSLGADLGVSPRFAFGGGLGYGRDRSDVGRDGTRAQGKAYTLAFYGSYQPGEAWFVDALVGYQRLSFDLRRATTAGYAYGERDGDQWLASLATGYVHRDEHFEVSPYARLDVARARLDGYVEQGAPIVALAYDAQDIDTTTGNLGLRMAFHQAMDWGVFSPMLRVEYQHDFEDGGIAGIRYADFSGGPFYRADVGGFDRNRWEFGLGASLFTDSHWMLRLEYRALLGGDGSDHGWLLNIEKSH